MAREDQKLERLDQKVDILSEKTRELETRADYFEGENHRNWGVVITISEQLKEACETTAYVKGKMDEWDKRFLYRVDALETSLDQLETETKNSQKVTDNKLAGFHEELHVIAQQRVGMSITQKVLYGAFTTILVVLMGLVVKYYFPGGN